VISVIPCIVTLLLLGSDPALKVCLETLEAMGPLLLGLDEYAAAVPGQATELTTLEDPATGLLCCLVEEGMDLTVLDLDLATSAGPRLPPGSC
jgi:hypothetical protein